jgi:hypothetical protein
MGTRLLSLWFLLLFAPACVFACSCSMPGPAPCHGLSPSAVLFVGTVLHVDNPPSDDGMGGGEAHYRFRIDDKLAGTQDPEIDIYSGRGGQTAVTIFNKASNIWCRRTKMPTVVCSRRSVVLRGRLSWLRHSFRNCGQCETINALHPFMAF